ncbi:MAG: hypothetical protein HOH13_02295 [Crocinitomicaceae bacterium]|nr:hypothetical protein [Crocinitomicaceae bacterium]MBT6029109.1 hypothetical protein [Crocinitomicaceae bacterium]MBT6515977.1 hypothetical protein [Crocinitomicaceae bacterium]
MKKIRFLLTTFVFCASFMCSIPVNAQVADGGPPTDPDGSDPPCWPPPCIPIDGGLGVLLAAGALFGGKKVYDATKESDLES